MICYHCMRSSESREPNCPYCGKEKSCSAYSHQLRPGTLLVQKYLIGAVLGNGGFGITYIGLDQTLQMRVAIKEYYPRGFSVRDNSISDEVSITASEKGNFHIGVDRFLREARSLAKFAGEPGVVGVRDYFQANGTAYIVMEYLDGITLKDYVEKNGPMAPGELFPMMRPVIRTLGKIHAEGLIHRDISPDNIMLLAEGRLKLLDFGAVREVGADKSSTVVLKQGYAPEEQYSSRGEQGPWTDVYALCCTMLYCLTGETPDDPLVRMLHSDDPDRLSGLGLSRKQQNALRTGMSIRRQDRWQNMKELEQALFGDRKKKKKPWWLLIPAVFLTGLMVYFALHGLPGARGSEASPSPAVSESPTPTPSPTVNESPTPTPTPTASESPTPTPVIPSPPAGGTVTLPPTPTQEATVTPAPESLREGTPSAADLDKLGMRGKIVYPYDTSWLMNYREAVIRAPGGYSVLGYVNPDRSGTPMEVLDGEQVTVLAEQDGMACVIVQSINRARWVNSNYLE